MSQIVLTDEIARHAKTQALLEAMEERQVTVDGNTYPLEAVPGDRSAGPIEYEVPFPAGSAA